jgi:two-component system nitrate/nitrite sensor histidine kinase NarX
VITLKKPRQMNSRLRQVSALINGFSQRTLYAKLLMLLGCLLLTVLLMQASNFFLLDYIPSSQAAIDKVNTQKVYWHRQLSFIDAVSLQEANNTFADMQQNYLRLDDTDVQWMLQQDNPDIRTAVRRVEQLQESFNRVAAYNMRLTAQLRLAERIAESYDELNIALQRDSEVKRSVIGLLQSVSLIFVFSCALVIAIAARKLLVERFDHMLHFINQRVRSHDKHSGDDEFALIESRIAEVTAQAQGADAEISWANRTSEQVKTLIRAQDFLLRFIESASEDVMSERTLLKMLYSLERVFNFNNAALIYTDDAAVITSERVIFSHHKPNSMNSERFDQLLSSGMLSFNDHNNDNQAVSCLAVSFPSTSNGIGVLLVEMEYTRLLEDSEIKILEITTNLLAMVAKYQSHDEEGRRLAVLEERSAIARELHDSLAQSLSFMKIQVARLQSTQLDEIKQTDAIKELREGLDNAYRELRELLTTFRVHMDLRGLGYAIQAAIDEFSQRSDISISLDNRLINCRLTVNEEFHILHVVREALSNIVRHSGASVVSVLMRMIRSGAVELIIDDNGVGLTPASPTYDHHGQAIMKERAYNLGGEIEVMNRRYGGTRVRLVFTPKLAQ